VIYALTSRKLFIVEDNSIKKEFSFNYDAKSLEINEDNNEIYIGEYVR